MNDNARTVRTAVILYEPEQVKEFIHTKTMLLAGVPEPLIIALDKEVEFLLEEARIPFRSGHTYQPDNPFESYVRAEEWARKILLGPAWSFFLYREVPFTETFFSPFQVYLQRLFYFSNIFAGISEKHPSLERVIIFPSFVLTSPTTGYLARREADLTLACAKVVFESGGRIVIIPEVVSAHERSAKMYTFVFSLKRIVFDVLLSLWNISIRLLRSPGTPRVLVSDYWRNIEPIVPQLAGGEIIMFDRGEALNAGLANMWRYRMRFYHFGTFSTGRSGGERARALFREEWERLQGNAAYLSDYAVRGHSVRTLLIEVLDDIINRAIKHTIEEVDGTYELLRALMPDAILLRTSVSSQTHFASLAYVGRALGIPAVELQHGVEYLGPGSSSKRHAAEYIGVYGQLIQKEFERLGVARRRLPIVGSPRFDIYATKNVRIGTSARINARDQFRVLCIAPITASGEYYDTYAVSEYFRAVASAVRKTPGAVLTIKLRPGSRRESFYRTAIAQACSGMSYTIAQYESLLDLFQSSDTVISGYSTAILESLQCGKPTIAFASINLEAETMRFHFSSYAEKGAIVLTTNESELSAALLHLRNDSSAREQMSSATRIFLERNYSFDGKASARIAGLIKKLASASV